MNKKLLNRKIINPNVQTFTGIKHSDKINIQQFIYNKSGCSENLSYSASEFKGFNENEYFYWLNIHGIHDSYIISNICSKLNIHDLTIQDILDVNQRPKFQEYENYWFFTLKSVIPSNENTIEQEQLSFILGKNYLISFQEQKRDFFNHIRERLRNDIGIIRKQKPDYLLYLLLESILDNYFKTLNEIEKKTNAIKILEIEKDPSPTIIKSIENFKRQIHQIKKTILPIKEFITKTEREKFNFIENKNVKYFYEIQDLCLSLTDTCEQLEVILDSNTNLFFSIQGHRMNQVVKILTVVSTIFIPLTFIAGVYGMNFTYMPELKWKWSYFAIWVMMIAIFAGMILYFKKKRWF